jgi:hypothetical protein
VFLNYKEIPHEKEITFTMLHHLPFWPQNPAKVTK